MLRMRFKEKQSKSQKTIPKLVRTREECTASLAPLRWLFMKFPMLFAG